MTIGAVGSWLDDLGVMGGDLVCSLADQCVGVGAGRGGVGAVAGPSGGDRVIAGLAVQIDPVLPGVAVDPEAVDEDDGGGGEVGHEGLLR